MSRATALIVTAGLTLLGFVGGFLVAAAAGFEATNKSECDGLCFDQWDEAFLIALAVALLTAGLVGFTTWQRIKGRIKTKPARR